MNKEELMHDLHEIFRGFKRLMQEMVEGENLSPTHFSALRFLWKKGPASMSQLADCLCLTHGAVTGIVDRLENKQLVERIHSTEDRRMVQVQLTKAGAAYQEGILEQSRAHIAAILDLLDPEAQEATAEGLRLFSEAMQRFEMQARERKTHAGE